VWWPSPPPPSTSPADVAHGAAVAAKAEADELRKQLVAKDQEIAGLKLRIPPRVPPPPAVPPDASREQVVKGLQDLGLEGLELSVDSGRRVWEWGLEAPLVAPLQARQEALEQVIAAQDQRITLGESESARLRSALASETDSGLALRRALGEANKSVTREQVKGKLKLYGGVAIGLGAGWLIFHK
jgi:hypothetical protein